jgi:hypothetical protein
MSHRRSGLLVLGVLAVALMAGIAPARTWHVPGEVTLAQALQLAEQGDVIGIAPGTHKIEGAGHRLPTDVTICADIKAPGVVVIEEARPNAWSWRSEPVFILDPAHGPGSADAVTFRGITFRNFDRTFGPNQFDAYPIFEIWNGKLLLDDCLFEDYHGTPLAFRGGSGEVTGSAFVGGHGNPAVIRFQGESLRVASSEFHGNTSRTPGDGVQPHDPVPGAMLRLEAGRTDLVNNQLTDNGPLTYVLDVGPKAEAYAHSCCFRPNSCLFTGRVTGRLQLDCCETSGADWEVLDGGVLIITDRGGPDKAASVEQTSLTGVKTLFRE